MEGVGHWRWGLRIIAWLHFLSFLFSKMFFFSFNVLCV